MKEYSFEKLEVWETANKFVKKIYKVTQNFPSDEKYCLTSQLRRAALSITNNIAEGSGRITAKDKANFTQMSSGSLMECLNLIIISKDLNMMAMQEINELRNDINTLAQRLSKLRRAQLNNPQTLNY